MRKRTSALLLVVGLAGTIVGVGGARAKPFDGGSATAPCGQAPAPHSISYSPTRLWPPNHALRDVTITANTGTFNVTRVTHDEEGKEKGATAQHEPDVVITDSFGGAPSDPVVVRLLSERLAKPRDGRTYIIHVDCFDDDFVVGSTDLYVTIPHGRGKKK